MLFPQGQYQWMSTVLYEKGVAGLYVQETSDLGLEVIFSPCPLYLSQEAEITVMFHL